MYYALCLRTREITAKSLTDVIEALFPGSGYVIGSASEPGQTEYWLVPGSGHLPRWILPVGYARLFYPILRRWKPYGRLSLLKWEIVCIAYRLNFLRFLPSVAQISVTKNHCLAPAFANDRTFITYVGTSGPTQKLVCTSFGDEGHKDSTIIKIPLGDKSRNSIAREAQTLSALKEAFPSVAPQLIDVGDNYQYSEQEFIEGTLLPRKINSKIINFLTELKHKDLIYDLSNIDALALECEPILSGNFEPDISLLRALARKLSHIGPVPAVWQHGDFAPWNIIVRNDRVVAIDWEFSERIGLPGYDLTYFFSMQSQLFGNDFWHSAVLESSQRQYLEAVGLDPELWMEFVLASLTLNSVLSARSGEIERFRYLVRQIRDAEIGRI